MTNSKLGYWLIISIGWIMATVLVENITPPALNDMLASIGALGMIVFGVWAGIRLINTK